MLITFTHIPPPVPGGKASSAGYYNKGYAFADDALRRYGIEACAGMRKGLHVSSSYEQGAADRWDDKPNKYGNQGA